MTRQGRLYTQSRRVLCCSLVGGETLLYLVSDAMQSLGVVSLSGVSEKRRDGAYLLRMPYNTGECIAVEAVLYAFSQRFRGWWSRRKSHLTCHLACKVCCFARVVFTSQPAGHVLNTVTFVVG